jgi:hypothetical protein
MAFCSLDIPLPLSYTALCPCTALYPFTAHKGSLRSFMALCTLDIPLPLCGPPIPQRPSTPSVLASTPSTALCPFTALCRLYDPLSSPGPSFPSTTLCPVSGPLSSLWPCLTTMNVCLLHGPLSPLRPSVPLMALCSLCSLLSPLWPSVPLMALCPLYGPLPPFTLIYGPTPLFGPLYPSIDICPLYNPLPPLWHPVPSTGQFFYIIVSRNDDFISLFCGIRFGDTGHPFHKRAKQAKRPFCFVI